MVYLCSNLFNQLFKNYTWTYFKLNTTQEKQILLTKATNLLSVDRTRATMSFRNFGEKTTISSVASTFSGRNRFKNTSQLKSGTIFCSSLIVILLYRVPVSCFILSGVVACKNKHQVIFYFLINSIISIQLKRSSKKKFCKQCGQGHV